MRLLTLFLTAAGVQMAAAATTTIKPSVTTTKTTSTTSACPSRVTTVVTFDALKAGQAAGVVQGYNFTSFTVQTGEFAGVKPSSGKNVAITPFIRSYVVGDIFYLQDFTFACVSNYPFRTNFPVGCSIKLIPSFPSFSVRIREYGPFTYTPDYSKVNQSDPVFYKYFPLQKVSFNDTSGPGGNEIDFFTSDATGGAQIVFDTFTFVKYNSCP